MYDCTAVRFWFAFYYHITVEKQRRNCGNNADISVYHQI